MYLDNHPSLSHTPPVLTSILYLATPILYIAAPILYLAKPILYIATTYPLPSHIHTVSLATPVLYIVTPTLYIAHPSSTLATPILTLVSGRMRRKRRKPTPEMPAYRKNVFCNNINNISHVCNNVPQWCFNY